MAAVKELAAVAVLALAAVAASAVLWPQTTPSQPGGDDAPKAPDGGDGGGSDGPSDESSMVATLRSVDKPVDTHRYPVQGPDGQRIGEATWRVIEGTGNCCENYVTTTPTGRIVDLGGTYPVFSDDRGRTWTEVQGAVPGINGEGALVPAPDGDLLAVMWDPYSGDRLVAYRYDNATRTWDYAETPLKNPFFDRPWLSVIPGPVSDGATEAPFAGYLKGGWPSKEVGYVSLDGLRYTRPSSPSVESQVPGGRGPLDLASADWADWVQPHTESGVTPLPGGGALAHQNFVGSSCPWQIAGEDLRWRCREVPGLSEGRVLADSRARLHQVDVAGETVSWRISPDGGASWNQTTVTIPAAFDVESWDVKVHAGLDVGYLALHVHEASAGADRDVLFRFDVSGPTAHVARRFHVGNGTLNAGAGVLGGDRFDFSTLGILPDGGVVASFTDADHHPPSLAVLVHEPGIGTAPVQNG